MDNCNPNVIMKQPLISIIVPCYNVEEFIHETVECILSQTYSHWELILVDDGSKDHTPHICDEYAAKDERIKVIHKPNGGLVSARNAGYDVMNGQWHMYLDGDDWIDTDTCRKLINYLEAKEDIDIIFWKYIQELGENSIKGKFEWICTDKEHVYSNDECHELAKHTLIYKSGIATAYCKLIRTSYARAHNIRHDDRLKQGAEGLEFSLRAFYNAKKVLYVNEYFNHYRYNSNSISKKVDEKNTQYLMDCFSVIEDNIYSFQDKNIFITPLYQRVAYVAIAIAMNTYFHPKNADSIFVKMTKYRKVINDNRILKASIAKCNMAGMDNQRKLTLVLIRLHCYFLLPLIGWLKQYYLKKGKYNY